MTQAMVDQWPLPARFLSLNPYARSLQRPFGRREPTADDPAEEVPTMARTRYALAAARPSGATYEFLFVETRGGTLTLPKGRRERGESGLQAARREVREEAGLVVRRRELTGQVAVYGHRTAKGREHTVVAYVALGGRGAQRRKADRWRSRCWLTSEQVRHDDRVGDALVAVIDDLDWRLSADRQALAQIAA